MANDLKEVRDDLAQISKEAEKSAQTIAELRRELEQLVKQYARGGTPTESGFEGFLKRSQEGTAGQRSRVGGDAYLSMSKEAQQKIQEAVSKYVAALNRNTEILDRQAELQRKLKGEIALANFGKTPQRGCQSTS